MAEAMARGKAVVLPDHGSAVEFTPDHLSYKFPAFRCASCPIGDRREREKEGGSWWTHTGGRKAAA